MRAWWEGLDKDDQVLLIILLIPVVTFLIIVAPAAAVGLGGFALIAFMYHAESKRSSISDRYFDELAHRRGWWEEDDGE